LQPNTADPDGIAAAPAVIDRRQCQQAARLIGILRPLRQLAQSPGLVILPKANRSCHGKPPPFASVNHICSALGIPRVSRLQGDLVLVEFTLLKAYLAAGRQDDARRMLSLRRRGTSRLPVAGLAAMH
jgi:hypothetical protein